MEREIPRAASRVHISLWDKAVGTPDYNKEQWIQLDNQINRTERKLQKIAALIDPNNGNGYYGTALANEIGKILNG